MRSRPGIDLALFRGSDRDDTRRAVVEDEGDAFRVDAEGWTTARGGETPS